MWMKTGKYIFRFFLLSLLSAILITSCHTDPEPGYDYFISGELALSYQETNVNYMIDEAVKVYPEIAEIKPYVASGVDVYKLVYKTEAGGMDIEASGLVCVPSGGGSYPVLSFQNGTNTRHSDAPTANITAVSYTLVEIVSSLGFIVVIPDYPGFGNSSGIPHPYLIAEPTVRSITDMFKALNEAAGTEIPGITVENEYYLLGYSQGGWSTLTLHKALETTYNAEFNLAGSACGAGSYNMYHLFITMVTTETYPMPAYLAYIINAYWEYDQFTTPVSDILDESYASILSSLFDGNSTAGQINSQLTTSISELFKPAFLSGFTSSADYSSVRNALINNSISGWKTLKPLLLAHGENDTSVPVSATETMYAEMMNAGTSPDICRKSIYPGLGHGEGLIPCMIEGLTFLIDIREN